MFKTKKHPDFIIIHGRQEVMIPFNENLSNFLASIVYGAQKCEDTKGICMMTACDESCNSFFIHLLIYCKERDYIDFEYIFGDIEVYVEYTPVLTTKELYNSIILYDNTDCKKILKAKEELLKEEDSNLAYRDICTVKPPLDEAIRNKIKYKV